MAVITACAVNLKPAKAAAAPTATPTILGGAASTCYTGEAQKIVTNLPDGMRYYISTEKIDPTTIDAGKIVPEGYTALDYLQGTGTQYIDTGFATATGLVVKYAALYQEPEQPRGDLSAVAVGFMNNNNINHAFYPHRVTGDNQIKWNLWRGIDGFYYYYGSTIEQRYSIEFSTLSSNAYVNINGERLMPYDEFTTQTKTDGSVNEVWLYTANGQNENAAKVMLYYAVIYNSDGKLVRDFVPVRADNGTLGMYDLVGNKLYENNGTNEFIAGDAVNTAIKDWQWLDSVDAAENNRVLDADTTYYVYYYTPNTDTTTVTPLKVSSFNVHHHVFGDWQTTTPATCTTDGEREHVCQNCGHVESEVVPATGHNYVRTFDQGMTTFTCSLCGNAYQKECDGEHSHEFIDSTIAPDCTDIGSTIHTCTRCEYSYKDNFVPALGHSYGAWVTTEPATTDHAGEQERICERCGAKQNRTLPALAGSTTNGGKDNSGPLLWGIIIGVIAVLAGCGGLAWLLIALFKPKHQKKTEVATA